MVPSSRPWSGVGRMETQQKSSSVDSGFHRGYLRVFRVGHIPEDLRVCSKHLGGGLLPRVSSEEQVAGGERHVFCSSEGPRVRHGRVLRVQGPMQCEVGSRGGLRG